MSVVKHFRELKVYNEGFDAAMRIGERERRRERITRSGNFNRLPFSSPTSSTEMDRKIDRNRLSDIDRT